jgi:hypothetical protein
MPQSRSQCAVQPGEDVVDDEPGRIDDHLAVIEQGLQEIGKHFARGKVRLVGGAHVQAQRACKRAVEIEPEQIDVAPVVVRIRKYAVRAGGNRSVAHIGLVAQAEYRLALRRGVGPAILDPVEQPRDLIVKATFWGHVI